MREVLFECLRELDSLFLSESVEELEWFALPSEVVLICQIAKFTGVIVELCAQSLEDLVFLPYKLSLLYIILVCPDEPVLVFTDSIVHEAEGIASNHCLDSTHIPFLS